MPRKLLGFLTVLILLFSCTMPVGAATAPTVNLNGNRLSFDVPPTIKDGRTLVPLRAIFESLGATVDWNAATRTVRATKDDTVISLTIGEANAYRNKAMLPLDVPAQILNGRTLVPLRFVSEAMGAKVEWNGTTRTIAITTFPVSRGFMEGEMVAQYSGEWLDGQPHGYGMIKYGDGVVYIGNFAQGDRQGRGILFFPDGSTYSGEFRFNIWNGEGTMMLPDGSRYMRTFQNGEAYGPVTLLFTDGSKYVGQMNEDNMAQGYGTLSYPDGTVYQGNFLNGLMHGQGSIKFPHGTSYSGDFSNNMSHGNGTMIYPDGSRYVGQFEYNMAHGVGTLTQADGTKLEGIWREGQLVN